MTNTGRPTLLTPEIAKAICEGLAEPKSLTEICSADDMPARSTVNGWLHQGAALVKKAGAETDDGKKGMLLANPYVTFLDNYVRARELQADAFVDESIDIADDGRNDWMTRVDKRTGETYQVPNLEHIARSKLRVETRMKVAANLNPKKYGQRVEAMLRTDPEAPPVFTLKIDNS